MNRIGDRVGIKVRAHHISFPVSDLDRSREFYEGILGLSLVPRPNLGGLRGAWYAAGDCEVHLIETPNGVDVGLPPPKLNPLARHAAFAIGDYGETHSFLQSHGFEILENPEAAQMWIRDPDGHIIELIVPGQINIEDSSA